MRQIILVSFIMLFAGCTVGPDYVRPHVDTPAAFRFSDADATATANTAWWEQFQDPTLNALIAEAIANNKNVAIAAANIEKAQGVLMQTRAPLFPQLSYTGNAARQRLSELGATPLSPTLSNPQVSLQTTANASWEIDLWGRIQRLSEAARANLLASQEAQRGVILSLTASVASSYIQLLAYDQQLQIARRTLAAYAESVKLFELQFAYGQLSRMNVEQARTQYETAAGMIPQIETQIGQTENALSILLGKNPGPIARSRSIDDLMLPTVPAELPSSVLANRPDIGEAEQNLIAANAQIGAARALYFPTLSLTGDFGYASADLSNLFNGPAHTWNYSGSIAGPIFKAGEVAGQVQQAEAGRKAALLKYESAIQSAFSDVENALIARRKITEQLTAQERLVKASKEYAHLAQIQYDGGYATYLTVLSAEQQLFPAELNQVQYHAQELNSYVTLYKAMGGGWKSAEAVATPAPPHE